MPTNSDFKELLKSLNAANVEFLLVGAHAVMFYAQPRFTKDIDLWVNPQRENTEKLVVALREFGAPLQGITASDFTNQELVYQMGVPPNRIDIVMGVDGLTFEQAWKNRVRSQYDDVPFFLIAKEDLITNKRASGRPQDRLDLERLLE